MVELHVSPTCHVMAWPSDVFTIRGVKYEVHRCYYGNGPSATSRLAELASGWTLLSYGDVVDITEKIRNRTRQRREVPDKLEPAYQTSWARYYVARDVWRALRPLTNRCGCCNARMIKQRYIPGLGWGIAGYFAYINGTPPSDWRSVCSPRCKEVIRKRLKRKKQNGVHLKSAQEHLRAVRRWLRREREAQCQQ